ncbi:MAG: LamG-like jellyroll fold domain-containing protein [Verrucomicrobiota bacterium]
MLLPGVHARSTLSAQPSSTNKVLELDGNGSYVELPADLLRGAEEVTVESWVKWERFASWSRFFDFGASYYGVHMKQVGDSSTLNLSYAYESGLNSGSLIVPNLLRTNQWCHLAAVIGKTGLKLYFNGHLVGSARVGGTVPVPSDVMNYLGKSQWSNDAFFTGQIDELRVWNVERTADQIRAGLETKLTGHESGLIACWSFDSGDGAAALPGDRRAVFKGQARCIEAPRPATQGLSQPAVVRGTVLLENGGRAPGTSVRLEQEGSTLAQTEAGSRGSQNGVYELVLLHPNDKPYDVVAVWQLRTVTRAGVLLESGRTNVIDLTFADSGSLSGTLRMFDQTPHVAVPVQVLNGSNQVVATVLSDEAGNYRFENLSPGQYQLRCHVLGGFQYFVAQNESVFIPAEKNRQSPIANRKPATVTVQPGRALDKLDFRFAPFKKGTWTIYDSVSGLPRNPIFGLALETNGTLRVGTIGRVSRFDGWRFVTISDQGGLSSLSPSDQFRAKDGSRFARDNNKLVRVNGQQFTPLGEADGLPSPNVSAIASDTNGILWVGTSRGLRLFDGQQFSLAKEIEPLGNIAVTAIRQAKDGTMWIGSAAGAFHYSSTGLSHLSTRDGLLQDNVGSLDASAPGVVWFGFRGVNGGITRYDGNTCVNLTAADGVPMRDVRQVLAGPDGAVWIATARGLIRYDGETFITLTRRDGLRSDGRVYQVERDQDGSLWFASGFGSFMGGLFRYDGRRVTDIGASLGLPPCYAQQFKRDSRGILWIATRDYGLWRQQFSF